MVSIGTLFAFVVVSAGVLVLRRTHPDLPRPFRAPWSPVVPVAVGGRVAGADAQPARARRGRVCSSWMAIGVAIYFAYGYRRSRQGLDLCRSGSNILPAEAGSYIIFFVASGLSRKAA